MMNGNQETVIVYTKYPQPGHSKTRLSPALGAEGAAKLQRKMTSSIVTQLSEINKVRPIELTIHYDGGSRNLMEGWLGKSHLFVEQYGSNLGERMFNSFADHLGPGRRTVLVGSDCPAVDKSIIYEALDSLHNNKLAIGPTFDGGYYLLGINGSFNQEQLRLLFQGIHWSTNSVYLETMQRIKQLDFTFHTLPQLHDIDTPDDLRYLSDHPDNQ